MSAREIAREAGPLIMRVVAGAVFVVHGVQKITGGVEGFAGFVESLGIPAPLVVAYAVTALEVVGGALLIVGLISRVVGGLLALEMLATAFIVKVGLLGTPFIASEGAGWELDLALFALSAGILLIGPGRVAFDAAFGIERSRGRAPSQPSTQDTAR